jgi:membrane protein implicated in regulation of membrane protease activity
MDMDFFQWHWWAGLALLMMIAEIFLPGFFLFCLGIGCIAASITASLGFGPAGQLLVFSGFLAYRLLHGASHTDEALLAERPRAHQC